MKLEIAQKIVAAALASARSHKFKPLAVAVLDARGVPQGSAAEDGTSLKRAEIAIGKAHGALAMGLGSRTLVTRCPAQPHFMAAVTHAVGGIADPGAGRRADPRRRRARCSARSASPATPPTTTRSAALAGIEAAGCKADPGA